MMGKNFLKSKTMRGLLVVLIGAVLNFFVDQGFISETFYSALVEFLSYVAQGLGIAYAAYGRTVTNGEKLTLLSSKPTE